MRLLSPTGWLRQSVLLAVGFGLLLSSAQANAQGRPRIAGAASDPDDLAKTMAEYEKGSQRRSWENRDGVYLELTYWRAKSPSITTPVVVLLPMMGRTQRDWYPFAHELYEDGFAVITFDFRGQGDSTHINPDRYKTPDDIEEERKAREIQRRTGRRVVIPGSRSEKERRARGDTISYKDDFRSARELGEMMIRDLEDVKRFIIDLHNRRELNVRQFGIVAAEMSCNVALGWMKDYEFREPVKTGWTREGGDLSTLVLISPSTNYEGFRAETKFAKTADDVHMLIVSASEGPTARDAGRMARVLRVPELVPGEPPRSKSYYRPESAWMQVGSKLEGTFLFKPPVDNIDAAVRGYLKARLTEERGRAWKERKTDVDLGFGAGRVVD